MRERPVCPSGHFAELHAPRSREEARAGGKPGGRAAVSTAAPFPPGAGCRIFPSPFGKHKGHLRLGTSRDSKSTEQERPRPVSDTQLGQHEPPRSSKHHLPPPPAPAKRRLLRGPAVPITCWPPLPGQRSQGGVGSEADPVTRGGQLTPGSTGPPGDGTCAGPCRARGARSAHGRCTRGRRLRVDRPRGRRKGSAQMHHTSRDRYSRGLPVTQGSRAAFSGGGGGAELRSRGAGAAGAGRGRGTDTA